MAISGVNGGAIPLSPNYIINSDFSVWQRLPYGTTSFNANASYMFTADRWVILSDNTGGNVTVSKQNFTPGELVVPGAEGASYIRNSAVSPTGANYNVFQYKIEDVRTLAGQTATLSFYAKADKAVTILSQFFQGFGTGGSAEIYTGTSPSHDLTTTWQRYTATFTFPSITGKTIGVGSSLRLEFKLPQNQSQVVDIWGVQVEAGSVATPYRRNQSTQYAELAACQRYYYRIGTGGGLSTLFFHGWGYSSTAIQGSIQFPVTMRANPSATLEWSSLTAQDVSTGGMFGFTTVTTNGTTPHNAWILITGASGLTAYRQYSVMANSNNMAYLAFNAELP